MINDVVPKAVQLATCVDFILPNSMIICMTSGKWPTWDSIPQDSTINLPMCSATLPNARLLNVILSVLPVLLSLLWQLLHQE